MAYGAMAALAAVLHVSLGDDLITLWRAGPSPFAAEYTVALGAAVGLLTVLAGRLLGHSARWRQATDAFRRAFEGVPPSAIFPMALMSSVAEELFCRGFLQPHLGLEITALTFAVIHVPFDRRLIPWWQISALVMGLCFGALVEWTGTLTAATVAHFLINYFNLHQIIGLTDSGQIAATR